MSPSRSRATDHIFLSEYNESSLYLTNGEVVRTINVGNGARRLTHPISMTHDEQYTARAWVKTRETRLTLSCHASEGTKDWAAKESR